MTKTVMEDDGYSVSAEFYDEVTVYRSREDIGYYLQLAADCGGTVLELGCGTGRVLIPIALRGIPVTGLDSSGEMLDLCREKLSDLGISGEVDLIQADMRDFDLGREFDLVIVPFRAFQHLETADDQLACLASVVKHMKRGATFVLDLFNPDMSRILDESLREEYGEEEPFEMPDGRKVTRRFRTAATDLPEQLMDCEIIYHVENPDGTSSKQIHSFTLRWLFRWEAEHLLERAGLRVVEVSGDYDGGRFGGNWSGELILKAVKP